MQGAAKTVEKRLTDEQAELAGEYWEEAMKVARFFRKKHPFRDIDWESAVAIGLCDAAYRYEAWRGVKFWTFATPRVRFACVDMMRNAALHGCRRNVNYAGAPGIYSLSSIIYVGSNPDGSASRSGRLLDLLISDDDPTGWEIRSIDAVDGIIRCLGKNAREIMRLYYQHGLTMEAVGERLGISESRVSQVHTQSIAYLRKAMTHHALAS